MRISKHTLIPLSAGLLILWGACLMMSYLFRVEDSLLDTAEIKKASRGAKSVSRQLTDDKHEVKPTLRKEVADKEAGAVAQKRKEDQIKKVKNAKLAGDLEILQKGRRSNSEFNNLSLVVDERGILRDEIMNEAYRLALKGENPWAFLLPVAQRYYKLGDKVETRRVLKKAESLAFYPGDQSRTSKAVLEVLKMMLALDQSGMAQDALQNIQSSSQKQSAMSAVVSWAALQGELELARNIMPSITSVAERDSAAISLAASEAAHEGVSQSMQTASSITNAKKRNKAYQRIAVARAVLKDYTGAIQVVQMIDDDRVEEAAHVSLAKLRARAGDLQGSLGAIQYLKNKDVADISLRDLSQQLAVSGEFSNSAFVSNRIQGDDLRSQALERLSAEQARVGDISGSLTRVSAIPSEMIRNRSMITLSGITANTSTPGQARNIASLISYGIQRDRAYKAIALASASAGNYTDAYNTLQDISRHEEKALALVSLARKSQQQGDPVKALSMLEDASRESQYVQSGNDLDKILSDMSQAYAERGDVNSSLSMASTILSLKQKDKTYQKLASKFVGYDIDAAQFSILSIISEKTKVKTEDAVAKALAQGADPEQAIAEARSLETGRQKIVFLLEVAALL